MKARTVNNGALARRGTPCKSGSSRRRRRRPSSARRPYTIRYKSLNTHTQTQVYQYMYHVVYFCILYYIYTCMCYRLFRRISAAAVDTTTRHTSGRNHEPCTRFKSPRICSSYTYGAAAAVRIYKKILFFLYEPTTCMARYQNETSRSEAYARKTSF